VPRKGRPRRSPRRRCCRPWRSRSPASAPSTRGAPGTSAPRRH
jgi:hypothetical protein